MDMNQAAKLMGMLNEGFVRANPASCQTDCLWENPPLIFRPLRSAKAMLGELRPCGQTFLVGGDELKSNPNGAWSYRKW